MFPITFVIRKFLLFSPKDPVRPTVWLDQCSYVVNEGGMGTVNIVRGADDTAVNLFVGESIIMVRF